MSLTLVTEIALPVAHVNIACKYPVANLVGAYSPSLGADLDKHPPIRSVSYATSPA